MYSRSRASQSIWLQECPCAFTDEKHIFELSKLWLPNGFFGELPHAKMYWVYSSNLDLLRDRSGKFTLVLDGSPPDLWDWSIVPLIYGLDASKVSIEVWREWFVLLNEAPIEQCAFPETLQRLDCIPKWLSMLKVVKIPPLCQIRETIA